MTTASHDLAAGAVGPLGWTGSSVTPVGAPRNPLLLARAGAGLSAAGGWFWQALEAAGHRRASRVLLQSAQRWDGYDPELAAQLRAAAHRNAQHERGARS